MSRVVIEESAPELENETYYLPQRPIYHSVISEVYGGKIYYAKQYKHGEVLHILPFVLISNPVFGKKIVSMPYDGSYGDVIRLKDCEPSDELYMEVLQFAKKNNIGYVEIRSRGENSILKRLGFEDDISLIISEVNIEEIYSNSKYLRKRRKNNSLAQKYGVQVDISNDISDLKQFYKIMSLNMRSYGTPMYPFSYFYQVWSSFHSQENAVLIKGIFNGEMVSGLLLLFSGKNAVLKYSAALNKFISKRLYPTMKWFAMDMCREKKCSILNMGTSFADDLGLIAAKEGLGAKTIPLVTYTKVLQGKSHPLRFYQDKYRVLIHLWKYQPLFLSQLLGGVFWRWYC